MGDLENKLNNNSEEIENNDEEFRPPGFEPPSSPRRYKEDDPPMTGHHALGEITPEEVEIRRKKNYEKKQSEKIKEIIKKNKSYNDDEGEDNHEEFRPMGFLPPPSPRVRKKDDPPMTWPAPTGCITPDEFEKSKKKYEKEQSEKIKKNIKEINLKTIDYSPAPPPNKGPDAPNDPPFDPGEFKPGLEKPTDYKK